MWELTHPNQLRDCVCVRVCGMHAACVCAHEWASQPDIARSARRERMPNNIDKTGGVECVTLSCTFSMFLFFVVDCSLTHAVADVWRDVWCFGHNEYCIHCIMLCTYSRSLTLSSVLFRLFARSLMVFISYFVCLCVYMPSHKCHLFSISLSFVLRFLHFGESSPLKQNDARSHSHIVLSHSASRQAGMQAQHAHEEVEQHTHKALSTLSIARFQPNSIC